jgi:hypothetical protein
MLLLTTLYHEYGHTFGRYAHNGADTPDDLAERGWALEDNMFGGSLRLEFGDLSFDRIEDLDLERHGERIAIRELPPIIDYNHFLTCDCRRPFICPSSRYNIYTRQQSFASLDSW